MRARGDGSSLSKDMEGMFTTLRHGVTAPEPAKLEKKKSLLVGAAKKVKIAALKRLKSEVKTVKSKPKGVRKPRRRYLKV